MTTAHNFSLLIIPPLLAAAINLALTYWVYQQAPAGQIRRTFLIWSFALALWNIGIAMGYSVSSEHDALNWYRWIVAPVVRFLPVLFLQFVMSITQTVAESRNRIILRAAYACSSIFLLLTPISILHVHHFYWGYYPVAEPIEALFGLPFFAMVFYSIRLLYAEWQEAWGVRKKHMEYLLLGTAICFGGGFTNFLPLYGVAIYPVGNLMNSFYSLVIAYAIVEHELMDIRIIFRRGVVYAVLSGGLTAVYLSLVAVLQLMFKRYGTSQSIAFYTASFPITVILAPTMKTRIESIVNRVFSFGHVSTGTPMFKNGDMNLMGILATEMAHELSKPLTHIMNEESRIGGSAIEASTKKSLARIRKEVQRAEEILDGFALLSPNRLLYQIPMSLETLLEEALAALGVEEDANIVVVRRYEKVPAVFVNPGQIVQVFTNIIQNAWQAMTKGGTLSLIIMPGLLRNHAALALIVEDTGPGIPLEIQGKLFEPFFTTKKTQGGRGVGLTISKAMIQRHEGTIAIESPARATGGTRVRIVLPLEKKDNTA